MTIEALQHSRPDQAYVKVTPMVAGTITLPEHAFVTPVEPSSKQTVPCMCFLVEHPRSRFMFDLGLRAEPEDYISSIRAHLRNRQPVTHRPSAPEILEANGIDPRSIRAVVLSHVHWDHHGDPTAFPRATFYVGQGSMEVIARGLPGLGSHSHFDPDLFLRNHSCELLTPEVGQPMLATGSAASTPLLGDSADPQKPPVWQALDPFPAAADIFGDGSVFLVPAPGHLPGHINLLCRVAADEWVYLGGDVYHDVRLLSGQKDIATWEENGRTCCIHFDKEQAQRSIARISELHSVLRDAGLNLEIIAAHDSVWYAKNKHRCMTA